MLQRKNPLPPGRYWQDIFSDHWDEFHQWLAANQGSVAVETTETHVPQGVETGKAREFYIFRVKSPVVWNQTHWGFPTVADSRVKSSGDTVQRPDFPLDFTDQLGNDIDKLKKSTGFVVGLGIVGGLLVGAIILALRRPTNVE